MKEFVINEFLKRIEADEKNLNELCSELLKIDSFFPVTSVNGVKRISSKWLRSYIDGILASIKSDQRLPQSFKNEINERWEKVWESAHDLCDQVYALTNNNGLEIKMRNGKFAYNKQSVSELTKQKGIICLSDEQAEYFALLQEIVKSLCAASKWEKEHGYKNVTACGVNIESTNGRYKHCDLLQILSDGAGGYSLPPQSFELMCKDNVLGRKE